MMNGRIKSFLTPFFTHHGPILLFIFLMSTHGATQVKKAMMTGSAAKSGAPADLKVAPDLAQRLAKVRRVEMPFRTAGLSAREQQLVHKLVEACGYLESIYWRQSDPEGLTLYQSLASSQNRRDAELRRYMWINASRFDLIDQNKPFVGTEPVPPGRGFYTSSSIRSRRPQSTISSRSCVGIRKNLRPFPITLPFALFWSQRRKLCGRRRS
jgi:hypothetical protein